MNSALENLGRGAIGMVFLIMVCYLLSNNRRAIDWKLVVLGILAQVMFAMGVLHTTVAGQPVFWMLFGGVLIFTLIRKFSKARSAEKPVTYDTLNVSLSIVWQTLFVIGLILAPQLFGVWSNLAMTISLVTIVIVAFKMGGRYPELMKWNILISALVLTICVYTKVCPPGLFNIILQ